MKKIIYFCPQADAPAGGVKVIHRHCELINRLGGSSEVNLRCLEKSDAVLIGHGG